MSNTTEAVGESEPKINISVTFRHTESTDALKNYAEEKLQHCMEKYIKSDTDVDVILSVEKRDHQAEVLVKSTRFDVTAKSVTEDLYSAIDKVVDSVSVQVRKQKEKLVEHK